MNVLKVSKPPLPFVKNVTPKSSTDKVSAKMNPLSIPGHNSGSITIRKACAGVAPRSKAASYVFGFILLNRGNTLSTTYGVQNTTCAIQTVAKP